MKKISASLLHTPFLWAVAVVIVLALPRTASAGTLITMGPEWFSGGISSSWVQVTPSAFGAPDHGLLSVSDLSTALGLSTGDPRLVGSVSISVSQINFADDMFNSLWSADWGVTGTLPPLLVSGGSQDDWGVRFTGNITIPTLGLYNFGVLSDDGFVFVLHVGGDTYQIVNDGLFPRDRYGLPNDLLLGPGQYSFTLDAFDHLQAGVVSLGVWHEEPAPAGTPEPASSVLILTGLGVIAGLFRKKLRLIH